MIVEMGFDINQAKRALEAHDNHLGKAVESLIQEREIQSGFDPTEFAETSYPGIAAQHNSQLHLSSSDEEMDFGSPRRKPPPPPPRSSDTIADTVKQSAETWVSQASIIGQSMLSRASTLIQKGKQVVEKKLNSPPSSQTSFPRWMNVTNNDADLWEADPDAKKLDNNWKPYSDDMEREQQEERARRKRFDSGKMSSSSDDDYELQRSKTPVIPKISTPRPPDVPVVRIPSDQMSLIQQAKEQGNNFFKKGQFQEALQVYSKAMDLTPSEHVLYAVLSNNRAAAYIKQGQYAEAVKDCERARNLLIKLGGDGTIEGIQVKDQLIKAVLRQAGALESMEKFQEAAECYDWLSVHGGSSVAGVVAEGANRCRKASRFNTGQPIFRPKSTEPDLSWLKVEQTSTPPPPRPASTNGSRVLELRQQEEQQAQEQRERFRLKEIVEMRVELWRKGKEDNLRALLCTLADILWPEFGWQPVGLQDLLKPSQVKVRYMKAIARLHPDKVSKKATMEQELLASEIFCTLNRAWDIFKQQPQNVF